MNKEEILKIIKDFESVDINIQDTMDNCFGDPSFFIVPIVDDRFVPHRRIDQEYSDEEIIEHLENDPIYIGFLHVNDWDVEPSSFDKYVSLVDDFNLYNYDEDDESLRFYEIETSTDMILFVFNDEKDYIPCDCMIDYGIKVSKNEDSTYKVEFAYKAPGVTCMSNPRVSVIKEDAKNEWTSIDNPLNQLIIEKIYDFIEFN